MGVGLNDRFRLSQRLGKVKIRDKLLQSVFSFSVPAVRLLQNQFSLIRSIEASDGFQAQDFRRFVALPLHDLDLRQNPDRLIALIRVQVFERQPVSE